MYELDRKKFGAFVSELRKERSSRRGCLELFRMESYN